MINQEPDREKLGTLEPNPTLFQHSEPSANMPESAVSSIPAPCLPQGMLSTLRTVGTRPPLGEIEQCLHSGMRPRVFPVKLHTFKLEKIYNFEVNAFSGFLGRFFFPSAIVSVAFIYPKGGRMQENVTIHKRCGRKLQQVLLQDGSSLQDPCCLHGDSCLSLQCCLMEGGAVNPVSK